MTVKISEKQIKDGWRIVKFGEIAKEVRSTTKAPAEDGLEFYVGLEHLEPQSLRIASKGIIAEDNPSFTRRFSSGQILFGKSRCYQKKAAVADFDGICSGDIIVIEELYSKRFNLKVFLGVKTWHNFFICPVYPEESQPYDQNRIHARRNRKS